MEIKNISCTQFAGLRNCSLNFTEGVNVVYGKNESGKSTLVNLISRTLFQNARIDGRSDRDFRNLYFPAALRGSAIVADEVDGRITFQAKDGTYTLAKEWGADPRCSLTTPEGTVIRNQEQINALLKDILVYGEGVYAEMLFSSQRNSAEALQNILDASKKTDAKSEITEALSRAFAESDGVSIDAIGRAISQKIDEIRGKHWDVEKDAPVRKAGRWAAGLGEILKAYYALDDAKSLRDEFARLEEEADRTSNDYAARDAQCAAAEAEYNNFNAVASLLTVRSDRKKTLERDRSELNKLKNVLAVWPHVVADLDRARALQAEYNSRLIADKYAQAKELADGLAGLEAATKQPRPDNSEIALVRSAQRSVMNLENKLCGMNITAAIEMLGADSIRITSLRTGGEVDISGGSAAITEAVNISVPGVMNMRLSPANVDVPSTERQIASHRQDIANIFEKYGVGSLEELEECARAADLSKSRADALKGRLAVLLGDTTFEQLEAAARAVAGEIRPAADIRADILSVCGSADISSFVTEKATVERAYIADYGSIAGLEERTQKLAGDIRRAEQSLADVADVPAEYANISDPEAYLKKLKAGWEHWREQRECSLTAKTAAASKLELFVKNLQCDPAADVEEKECAFEEQRSLLKHWLHIEEVFNDLRDRVCSNPMQDIAESFTNYLGAISDNRVSSEFPRADKLDINIYSGKRQLGYDQLSEGTRETVSLAFRLAVLDHLFPEGGGVIVFDDSLTDMDAERAAQSCALIRQCAQRHQVIFLTCREEYASMVGGNLIKL